MGKKSRKKKENHNKRELFDQRTNRSSNTKFYIGIGVCVLLLATIVAVYALPSGGKSSSSKNRTKLKPVDYSGENVEMTPIKSTIKNGKLAINLADVEKNKFVSFSYEKNKVDTGLGTQALPMLAYIATSGDLVTAVSMCEPCKSISFHTESDNTLTCNACGTKFDIETLEGVSGACTAYPPDEVKYQVKNGEILIDESEIADWKPRV